MSTIVSISVKFVLAFYFLHEYSQRKSRAPIVWGMGFFFFGFSQIPGLSLRYFEDPATTTAFMILGLFLLILSLALLYYGASLICFPKGSFMREKLSIIFFAAMLAVTLTSPFIIPPERALDVGFFVAAGVILPISIAIAALFFVVWQKLVPDNSRRINVFFVGVAWLIYGVVNGIGSFFVGESVEWIFYILAIVSFLILLHGMTMGRATRPE
jgi:hypothetical protein